MRENGSTASLAYRPFQPEEAPPLVLASGSSIRRQMLENTGLVFDVEPSSIDEDAVKAALLRDPNMQAGDLAVLLAEAKATDVSNRHRGKVIIGADQVLSFNGALLSKSPNIAKVRRQLLDMAGKTHCLISASVLVRDGIILWRRADTVYVTMRKLSPAFVGAYLAEAGEDVLKSVGGYQLEGLGAQLLERIEGDYFTVLGLPLLPLLDALRDHAALSS